MASNLETKIGRIATAVTSALSALTAKGVTVPDGANVESLAALIEGIEAGGGGNTPLSNIAYGDITVNVAYGMVALNVMSETEWEALYGEFPSSFYGAIFDVNASEIKSGDFPLFIASATKNNTPVSSYMTVYYSNKISYVKKTTGVAQKNTNSKTIQIIADSSTYTFMPGRTYKWVILW